MLLNTYGEQILSKTHVFIAFKLSFTCQHVAAQIASKDLSFLQKLNRIRDAEDKLQLVNPN